MDVTWTRFLITLGSSLAGAAVLLLGVHVVVVVLGRGLARRRRWASPLLRTARIPFRLFVVAVTLAAVVAAVRPTAVSEAWWDRVALACRLLLIGSGAWLLAAALVFLEGLWLSGYRTDMADNRAARRVKTQVLIIQRLSIVAVVVLAVGAALLSFPGVEAVGASVLASAGVISIVAAVAAQSTLGNLFAGLQVAFSDAIRLGDVVIVETEWGWIEEITLTYVVVRLWDDRRLVLPSTYFTSTPFQNWTRKSSELLGAVELDVDWRVDLTGLRAELDRVLAATDLWDRRAKVLQVTDAVGGLVRVRALVTAADAGTLFDLRCLVREELVTWLQARHDGEGLPRQRFEPVEHHEHGGSSPGGLERPGVFSGDAAGAARAARFRQAEREAAREQPPGEPLGEPLGEPGEQSRGEGPGDDA